jgi:hypothetical protein
MELKMFNERLIFFNKLHQVPIHGRLSSVIRQLSVIGHLSSVIFHPPPVNGHRPTVNRQPSSVNEF